MKIDKKLELGTKRKIIALYLLFAFIPFLLVIPYFFSNMIFLGSDGIAFFSTKKFYTDTLLQGDFAFWNKYMMAGSPYEVFGNFYLPGFVLSFLPMKVFIILYYCLHLGFGGIFCYKYLREIRCSSFASAIVAILYECSIHIGGYRKDHMAIITCIVFLPFILYYAHKYVEESKLKWLLYAAIGMSFQFVTGGIQYALYTDIAVFFYIIALVQYNKGSTKKICKDIILWIASYSGLVMVYLVPTAVLMRQYSQGGAAQNTYENFKGWSIHFYKLLQMFFPYVFGDNILQAFGYYNSSELDIELFMGTVVVLIILFGIMNYHKEKLLRVSCGMMIVSFLYAAIAHIPGLRYLVYKLPIIGGFRCPARSLFIFIFFGFVILAITTTKMKEIIIMQRFSKFAKCFYISSGALLGLYGIIGGIYCHFSADLSGKSFVLYWLKAFLPFFIVSVVIMSLLRILGTSTMNPKSKYKVWLLTIGIITLCETLPYTILSNVSSESVFASIDAQSVTLQQDIGNYKVWDAFVGIDGAHNSIISQNTNVSKKIPAVNAYVTFNNPDIYKLFSDGQTGMLNYSGLLTGSLYANLNLKLQNDMLSMLGIKYIIDSSSLLTENNASILRDGIGQEIYKKDSIVIPNEQESFWIEGSPVPLHENGYYRIQFDAYAESSETLHCDFYGGEAYDFAAQEIVLNVDSENKHYTKYIPADDISLTNQPIQFRVYADPSSPIIIRNLSIEELDTTEQTYFLYNDEEGYYPIYENKNANDILMVPTRVQQIGSEKEFFDNMLEYSVDKVAYIKDDLNYEINNDNIRITNIQFTNNQITAQIDAKDEGFVMFSQCYYPGWRVFVNRSETKLYKVNGSIMGAELPSGSYELKFCYTPIYLYIGILLTVCTTIVIFLYIIILNSKDEKRKENKSNDKL